jgi:hypothetical protein
MGPPKRVDAQVIDGVIVGNVYFHADGSENTVGSMGGPEYLRNRVAELQGFAVAS